MIVELIHKVLTEHEVSTDHFRRRGGYCWWCSCETDGEDVHRTSAAARGAAAWHVAEQLSEVLGVPVAEELTGGWAGGGRR